MTLAFPAKPILAQEAPAVVHVDGTVSVQVVRREVNPRYHRLIEAFGRRTGVRVLSEPLVDVKGRSNVRLPRHSLPPSGPLAEILAAGFPHSQARPLMSVEFRSEGCVTCCGPALTGYSVLPMREALQATAARPVTPPAPRRGLLPRICGGDGGGRGAARHPLDVCFISSTTTTTTHQAPGGRRLVEHIAALGHEVGLRGILHLSLGQRLARSFTTRPCHPWRHRGPARRVGQPALPGRHTPIRCPCPGARRTYSEAIRTRFTYIRQRHEWRGVTRAISSGEAWRSSSWPTRSGGSRRARPRGEARHPAQHPPEGRALCEDFISMNGVLADRRRATRGSAASGESKRVVGRATDVGQTSTDVRHREASSISPAGRWRRRICAA
jgi:hypothetical protein